MVEYKYMRIPLSIIPDISIQLYNLLLLASSSSVMVEIQRGMYELPQAVILTKKQLRTHLESHGYSQVANTHDLFHHATRNISFTLGVDNFGSNTQQKATSPSHQHHQI